MMNLTAVNGAGRLDSKLHLFGRQLSVLCGSICHSAKAGTVEGVLSRTVIRV
jgi:hypothetical protein